jgi:hypothetical protein
MRLKSSVLDAIKDSKVRLKLQIALGVTDQTINRYIKDNSDDLTKYAAMVVIREVTGLADQEILEFEEVAATG